VEDFEAFGRLLTAVRPWLGQLVVVGGCVRIGCTRGKWKLDCARKGYRLSRRWA